MADKKMIEQTAKDYIKATGETTLKTDKWEAVGLATAIRLANGKYISDAEVAKIANETLQKVSKDSR